MASSKATFKRKLVEEKTARKPRKSLADGTVRIAIKPPDKQPKILRPLEQRVNA